MNILQQKSLCGKNGFSRFLSSAASRKVKPSGFALIATISVMALLVMVTLGMLSLSSVESRKSRQGSHMLKAQSNARLALTIALAQLQEQAGPDQRITARADITDPNWENSESTSSLNNPHYTYVWDISGAEHNLAGTSVGLTNDPGLKRPGALPGHDFTKKAAVLVSGNEFYNLVDKEGNRVTQYPAGYTTGESAVAGQINIVPAKSFFGSSNPDSISVPLVDVGDTGAYAYWIGDESIKSRANIGNKHETSSLAATLLAQRSPLNPLAEGLDSTAETLLNSEKVSTVKSFEILYQDKIPRDWSYSPDVTVSSDSLLINTRNGGFRQDFTYALYNDENADGIPAELKDDAVLLDSLRSIWANRLMPWGWKGIVQTFTGGLIPAVEYLRDYAQISTPSTQPVSMGQHNIAPVMSQFQGSIHCAYRVAGSSFRVYYSVLPAVTLWNPYNVPIILDKDMRIFVHRRSGTANGGLSAFNAEYNLIRGDGSRAYESGLIFNMVPVIDKDTGEAILDKVTGEPILEFKDGSEGWQYNLVIEGNDSTIIPPGEALIFSPRDQTIEDAPGRGYHANIVVEPGWRPGKGHLFAIDGVDHDATALDPGSSTLPRIEMGLGVFSHQNVTIEASYTDATGGTKRFSFWSRLGSFVGSGSAAIDPPLVSDAQQDARGNFPSFLYKYALRMGEDYLPLPATEIREGQDTLLFPYVAHYNPRAVYHAAFADSANTGLRFVGDSVGVSPSLMGSLFDQQASRQVYTIPTVNSNERNSYIGSGYLGPSEKMILSELPIKLSGSYPNSVSGGITSFTQLNNSNLTSGVPELYRSYYTLWLATSNYPAFPIGNSLGDFRLNLSGKNIDKSNLTSVNSVAKVDNQGWRSEAPHYDLSFLLNERLYDHYFFSTVPQTGSYDSNAPLINARMTPTTDEISELRSISAAKNLILKGGFNINSTSVKAWQMLLSSSMGTTRPGVSSSNNVATFSGNYPSSGSTNISSADVEAAATGEQSLSLNEEEIKRLAEAIVKQVKRRGPFPNLAAFVNRTNTLESLLRSDANSYSGDAFQDVRFSGALQAAIDSAALQNQLMQEKAIDPDDYLDNQNYYPAPQAVRKSANSHLPGTLKQSDILRQIDPIMTNRGDTFIIRTVGVSKDEGGRILAKAACEAVVQRTVNYVDPSQEPDVAPLSWDANNQQISNLNETNLKYGRRFEMKSFRWLTKVETSAMTVR